VDRAKFDLRWKVALGLQMDDKPESIEQLYLSPQTWCSIKDQPKGFGRFNH
jgi:hypothetical protein